MNTCQPIRIEYLDRQSFYPKRLTNEDIMEAIKTNKRAKTCKCYYKSWLAKRSTRRKLFVFDAPFKTLKDTLQNKIEETYFSLY